MSQSLRISVPGVGNDNVVEGGIGAPETGESEFENHLGSGVSGQARWLEGLSPTRFEISNLLRGRRRGRVDCRITHRKIVGCCRRLPFSRQATCSRGTYFLARATWCFTATPTYHNWELQPLPSKVQLLSPCQPVICRRYDRTSGLMMHWIDDRDQAPELRKEQVMSVAHSTPYPSLIKCRREGQLLGRAFQFLQSAN